MKPCLAMGAVSLTLLVLTGCQSTTVRGPHGQRMTVMHPADVTLARGDAEEVVLTVERENFSEPVGVDISNLPAGVEVIGEPDDKVSANTVTIVLRAKQEADLVSNHAATVTVKGPDGMKATEHLRITVRQ